MQHVLGDGGRLQLHVIAWGLVGTMLALLASNVFGVSWGQALGFGVPLGLLAAPLSLSALFLVRAMPLSRTSSWQIGISAAVASVIAASVWASVGQWWWSWLGRFGLPPEASASSTFVTLLVGFGALVYLLSLTVHYAMQATEASAALTQRELRSQVAARESELRALRAQVDPHFLFNSLNAVSGLIGADPVRAREMVQRLADFLRSSLTQGRVARIALARELELASSYLEIERVRFGERLQVRVETDPALEDVAVPPLLLQPLVENAVRHGIATRLEGGTIEIVARRRGELVWLTVSNPRDADEVRHGTGFGLDIVRRRLSGAFGGRAALAVETGEDSYAVSLTWPAERMDPAHGESGAKGVES